MNRKHIFLNFRLADAGHEAAEPTEDAGEDAPETAQGQGNEYPASFLVGDGTYNGIFFPAEEIEKGAASMDSQPVNLDHSFEVEDEVGFVRQVAFMENALRGILTLNPDTARYTVAKSFILNRLAAGKPPEVSVGVLLDIEETEDGRLIARNLEFDHLALVTRGACSPNDGCGIGMSASTQKAKVMTETNEPAPAAPAAEPAPAEAPQAESKPCGCGELKAQVEAVTKERDSLKVKLAGYEAAEFATLKAKAESLGVPIEAADKSDCLSKKIAVAEAVAAKLAAQPAPAPAVKHTVAAPATQNDASAAVQKLTALMGIPPVEF